MAPWVTFVLVMGGASAGFALGLVDRAKQNPELQGKGLKVLIFGDKKSDKDNKRQDKG